MVAAFELHLRQMLAERKPLGLIVFLLVPLLLSLLLHFVGEVDRAPPWAMGIYLFMLYAQVVCVLLSLHAASSILSAEVEMQTVTYLFTRPLYKWQIVVAKYAAMVTVMIPPTLASAVGSWLLVGLPGGTRVLASIVTCTIASLCTYGAVFVLLGILVPARAMVLGLIFVLVEFGLSFVPAALNTITVTYYLRSLAVQLSKIEVPVPAQRMVGGASLGGSCLVLGLMIGGALALACWFVSRREYIVSRNA